MTDTLFTHKLPTETVKDVAAAEREFYLDIRNAKDNTPKGMETVEVTLTFPDGLRFAVEAAGYEEGDPVHQLGSFHQARSVAFGSTTKGNRIRVIERGTENGGEVLLHPSAYITKMEDAA